MSDKSKAKLTEAEVQEWLDGVHFSSACNLPLVSSENKDKTEKASKDSSKNDNSELVTKNES